MFCKKCGVEVAKDAKFCSNCGNELGSKQSSLVTKFDFACEKCTGMMELDETGCILRCPYCGNTRKIKDKERERFEQYQKMSDTKATNLTDIEKMKLEQEYKREDRVWEEKQQEHKEKMDTEERRRLLMLGTVVWVVVLILILVIMPRAMI